MGDLEIDKNGTAYRDIVDMQYAGMSTPEMDDAWVDIIRGGGVDLVGKEAKSVASKTYQKPGGRHLRGTHVFHQLHCLNKLRKATHPEYYGHHGFEPQASGRMHLGEQNFLQMPIHPSFAFPPRRESEKGGFAVLSEQDRCN